ncbi:hypothetical protein CK203_070422 [Vitis vinifera]|uniref:Uncharacterized protein n=1 Tax=Vitis vinifera TaxID=29760 RepID=A0A438FAH9_VITVI|nr:hypothetical protein CK203_070422 [Vitis vinifera]
MAPKKTVSSVRVSEAGEKAIDKLNAKEFRERFASHDVLIDLVNEEAAMPTEKGEKTLSSSQRNNSTRGSGSLCQLVQGIPPLLSDSTHLHSSQPCPGADGMQHYQHACVRSPALPSNGDRTARFDKGRGEGAGGSRGGWAGLSQHPSRPFSPNYTLKIPGLELRGHLVDWVEKASFASPGICYQYSSRKLAKDEIVPGEHYTVKELPLYQEAKEADAERRRKLLEDRDQKKLKALSGRLPDRSGVRTLLQRKLQEKGEAGEEAWEGCEGTHSSQGVSSSQTTYEGEAFLGRGARLANVAEEAASINRPGNLNPDADAAETAPLEEAGQKAKSGLFERLQERQQEIEISCASAHDAHPDGGEVEMATETSAAPAIIPDEDVGSDSGTRVTLCFLI